MYQRGGGRIRDGSQSFFLHLHCLIFCVFPWGKPTVFAPTSEVSPPRKFSPSVCFGGWLPPLQFLWPGAKKHRGHLARRGGRVWGDLCVGVEREGRLTNRTCENSRQRGVQRVADIHWVSQGEVSPSGSSVGWCWW